jgi:hypothetical protein
LLTIADKKEWISLLRSKAFKQIRGTFRYINKNGIECFCALGVLRDKVLNKPEKPLGSIIGYDLWYDVTNWNDNMMLSFSQIADKLEQEFNFK